MKSRVQFVVSFSLTAFIHMAGTLWLLVADFTSGLAGLGSSGPNWGMAFWTPPAMYLWESWDRSSCEEWLLLLGIGWSAVVGVAWGLIVSVPVVHDPLS